MEDDDKNMEEWIVSEAAEAYQVQLRPEKKALRLLGVDDTDTYPNASHAFLKVIRGGLPRLSIDKIMEVSGLTVYEMADILNTTDRTLRRYDATTIINREQSERLLELALLITRGEEVLGGLETLRHWLNADVPALGNKKPKSYLDTSLGISMLMDELGRIEHGVFA